VIGLPKPTWEIWQGWMDDTVLDIGAPEFQYHGPDLAIWVVAPDDVYRMLREAGAPDPRHKPWARRDWGTGCAVIAYYMNFPLGYRVMPDGRCRISQEGLIRTELDREHDAIRELRRVSPKNIGRFDDNKAPAYFERPYGHTNNPRVRGLLKEFQEAEETRKKLLALLASLPPRPHVKPWWHFDAARLLDGYRRIVNASAGVSPDGPAVCFIEAALKLMGYSALPNRGGIVSALRRTPDWEYQAALQSLSYYR
jgi:hypothetical protein